MEGQHHNNNGNNGHTSSQNKGYQNGNVTNTGEAAMNGDKVKHKCDYNLHPFVYRLYPTRTERLIWCIMAFTLAPIKLLLFLTSVFLAWIPARIAVIGLPLEPDQPFTPWRLFLKDITVFFVRCAWFSMGVMSQKTKGTQASSAEAPLIVLGPHSSFVDTLAGALCGFPGTVSVAENSKLPFIATLFRVNQSIFVDRTDPHSRSKTAQKIRRRAEAKGAWPQLLVFPEGVCSASTSLLPYKLGAFLPGVSVQLMTIKYNRTDLQTWVNTGPGLIALATLLLCTPLISFEVEFHQVYHPSDEEKENPELFAKNVRDLMSSYLKLPKTEVDQNDLRELVKRSRPNRGAVHMWKNLLVNGYIEMPSREYFS